jgi:hypothetical protein
MKQFLLLSCTSLLAFDADGNSYIYTAQKFKKLKRGRAVQTFVLDKIDNISNKQEVTSLLN